MSNTPLRERVPESDAPVLPPNRPGLSWRPATLDDVDRIAGLYKAMANVDHPNWAEARDEIEHELSQSYVDPERDTALAIDDSGRLVAFGQVYQPPLKETLVRAFLFGGVHPEHRGRGIGRELLEWQRNRALELFRTADEPLPGWVMASADERASASVRLFTRAGLAPTRYFLQLERVLAEPIPEIALPAEVRLVPYSGALSERVRQAKNAAFRDHWGSQPTSEEQWRSTEELDSFRAELSFVAMAGDEVVGLITTSVNEDDWAAQGFRGGYIALVGVVREWRRHGIAPALLARAMQAYRERGFERAVLDVDTDNPSGALGLYTGMGFTAAERSVAYTLQF